jgi:hypothetical protein
MNNVMNRVIKGRKRGIQRRIIKSCDDFNFADDICLLAQRWSDRKAKLEKLEKEAAKVGLKINEFKTKDMKVDPQTDLMLTINSMEVEQAISFTYLDRIITTDGGAQRTSRVASKENGALCS